MDTDTNLILLYLDGELDDEHAFEERLQNEPELKKAVEEYDAFLTRLRSLRDSPVPKELRESIMHKVREEARPLEFIGKQKREKKLHLGKTKYRTIFLVFVVNLIALTVLAGIVQALPPPLVDVVSEPVPAIIGIEHEDSFVRNYSISLRVEALESTIEALELLGGYNTSFHSSDDNGLRTAEISRVVPRLDGTLDFIRGLGVVITENAEARSIAYDLQYTQQALDILEYAQGQDHLHELEMLYLQQRMSSYQYLVDTVRLYISIVEAQDASPIFFQIGYILLRSNAIVLNALVVGLSWILPIILYVTVVSFMIRRVTSSKPSPKSPKKAKGD